MNNNNNRNGKEVHKGQMPDNLQKEGKPNPVNRIKKKNTSSAKEIIPTEQKKIPININKNPRNLAKGHPKGQVIKLGEKEDRNQPVEPAIKENLRTQPRVRPNFDSKEDSIAQPSVSKTPIDTNQSNRGNNESYKLSGSTGKWLLIAAALLLIAWAVIFFYYNVGGNSHMLLALAIIFAIISLVGKKNK